MQYYNYVDETLGIYADQGFLSIKLQDGNTIHLKEKPMSIYQSFYGKWMLAIQIAGDEDFINSYCFNDQFSDLINEALMEIGVSRPGALSPAQMETLLIKSYDKEGNMRPGVIFGFHSTYPKFPESRLTHIPWNLRRIYGQTLIIALISILQESLPITNLMDKILSKLSLYLLYLVSWLSKGIAKFPQTLISSKRLEQIDGKTK